MNRRRKSCYRPYEGKRWPLWRKAVLALLLAGALAFGALFGAVMYGAYDHIQGEPRLMVILGCQVKPWGPSILLQDRLDKALDYLEEHPDVQVVVSGGQGSDEPTTEAQAMYDYLTEHGVEPERIWQEDQSHNTWQNVRYTLALLEEKGSDRVIVFARTKNRTEDCAEALCDAGYRAESIHSDKSQGQRKRALDNFRRGRTSILVATDVLARGIDVPDVDHVINFDLPDMPEDYVHRIGRTGRAGEQGFAVSFVTRESRRTMSDIEKLIGKNVPLMELETYELDMTVLEKGKKGAPKKGGYKGNKGSGRPAGAKRSDKRGGEKRDFERRSDSRAEGRSDNRPGRGKRAEGKRSFDGAAKPDGPRSNNMDHAKRRLEMNEKKREKSAPNAKGAAKQNGSKKKAGVGGYNYSRFANN